METCGLNLNKTEERKVDNQHQKIKGYRDLSQEEIDLMNEVKDLGETLAALVRKLELISAPRSPLMGKGPEIDGRWVAIGTIHLQQGIMALVRSIAKPESF